jgi:DNA (cytosine-5)-methyltransferase 1
MPPDDVKLHERRSVPGERALTCIDLFSGAGGLAEGFRQAGFNILSGNDVDPAAAKTFCVNFPEASFFEGPVGAVTGAELLKDAGLAAGDLDCLIGGPPCQSFSYNNHERGRRKARARLFRDYLRIVEATAPNTIVMENVPGILTVGGGAVVDEIYDALSELGYACQARILYSEDYGVPQQRRRVFFVATRLPWDDALFPAGAFSPSHKPSVEANAFAHRWEKQPGRTYRPPPSVWTAIGDLPHLNNGEGEERTKYTRAPRTEYQRAMRGKQRTLYNHVTMCLKSPVLRRIRHVPEGGNWRDIPYQLLPEGMQRAKDSDHTKRYGRLSKRGLCCTILTKCDPHWGSYVHPEVDRAISVREAARLQSFPDRFRFLGFLGDQFRHIGNAVPPLMAAAVGNALREHIEQYA